ncbi:M14 family metallopeptidase [Candidatus Bathyarchaeota archaeon]|nr:M14 family metallopeptidase [Candidatus Bathyarchaeota archaeon]
MSRKTDEITEETKRQSSSFTVTKPPSGPSPSEESVCRRNGLGLSLPHVRASGLVPLVLAAALVCLVSLGPFVAPVQANYETKSALISKFKALAEKHPSKASYVSAGLSYQGRSIWLFRYGNPDGKRILWDAQLHGSEDLGSEIMYYMAQWLLESGDPRATRILQTCYILFIPVINVDSYSRGNANKYGGTAPNGVDLNRNFVYEWGSSGSGSRTSTNYRGPYAGSEKEAQVMRRVFSTYRPRFYLNTHTGGGPYLAYYWRSSSTIVNTVRSRISSLSSQAGVVPYKIQACGWGGMAVSDAYAFGAVSWLLELTGGTSPSYSSVYNYYLKCRPILIAMSQS